MPMPHTIPRNKSVICTGSFEPLRDPTRWRFYPTARWKDAASAAEFLHCWQERAACMVTYFCRKVQASRLCVTRAYDQFLQRTHFLFTKLPTSIQTFEDITPEMYAVFLQINNFAYSVDDDFGECAAFGPWARITVSDELPEVGFIAQPSKLASNITDPLLFIRDAWDALSEIKPLEPLMGFSWDLLTLDALVILHDATVSTLKTSMMTKRKSY